MFPCILPRCFFVSDDLDDVHLPLFRIISAPHSNERRPHSGVATVRSTLCWTRIAPSACQTRRTSSRASTRTPFTAPPSEIERCACARTELANISDHRSAFVCLFDVWPAGTELSAFRHPCAKDSTGRLSSDWESCCDHDSKPKPTSFLFNSFFDFSRFLIRFSHFYNVCNPCSLWLRHCARLTLSEPAASIARRSRRASISTSSSCITG